MQRDGPAPALTGVPVGLKDLFAVAGKPVTASSRLLDDVPAEDCDVWQRLRAAGMVLLGHLHTHEFAAGGTTDQVGSPWDLRRSAGGSSGGSAAALAARMVSRGDRHGHGRVAAHTLGLLRHLRRSSPHAVGSRSPGSSRCPGASITPVRWRARSQTAPCSCGRWPVPTVGAPRARSTCLFRSAPSAGRSRPLAGVRLAVSPRVAGVELDADVAPASTWRSRPAPSSAPRSWQRRLRRAPSVGDDFLDVLTTELLVYHRRFDGRRDLYRPALREWVEQGERRAVTGEAYVAAQARRREVTAAWAAWLDEHRLTALLEPTIPVVAPLRGDGYEHAGTDYALISLTHFWDWTGFPVAALPAGVGASSGLPVGVSLIGPAGSDWELLSVGIELQELLGCPPATLTPRQVFRAVRS